MTENEIVMESSIAGNTTITNKTKKRHINIPVFIPHLGCPCMCVFCNQRTISGKQCFDERSVPDIIEAALATAGDAECEIAFFGGSFTGIDRSLMIRLLEVGYKYVVDGRVTSLRCSTRPDYIDDEVMDILTKYGVKTVELGIQSMSDRVLAASRRGHTSEDTRRACAIIRAHGVTLGGQMMIGLPGSTIADEEETARAICSLGCAEARIYPTIVFAGTELADMTAAGEYTPLSVDEAAYRTARVMRILDDDGVKILRVGLCESENLHTGEYIAGPNHPAIGEIAANILYYEDICSAIDSEIAGGADVAGRCAIIYVSDGAQSKAAGQRGKNKMMLAERYGLRDVKIKGGAKLSPGKRVSVELV